jgi:hypothetical protein
MCFLLWAAAEAAQWEVFTKDSAGCPNSYDTKNVSRKGSIVRVWTKISAKDQKACSEALTVPGEVKAHKAQEMRSLLEINCAKKAFRMVATKVYDSSRIVLVDEKNAKSRWEPIPPETVAEALSRKVCK